MHINEGVLLQKYAYECVLLEAASLRRGGFCSNRVYNHVMELKSILNIFFKTFSLASGRVPESIALTSD